MKRDEKIGLPIIEKKELIPRTDKYNKKRKRNRIIGKEMRKLAMQFL